MDDQRKTKAQLLGEVSVLRRQLDEQRRLVAELQVRVGRYRSVVDNVVDGIITVDEQGTLVSLNPAAEQIFGYPAGQARGQHYTILLAESHPGGHDEYLRAYLRTGDHAATAAGREGMGRRRDGTTFPIDLAINEVRLGDRRLFTGIVRDITERKRLEGQLLQAQKMESIGQFAGGIAHDFNNQLGIILFDLDMLIASVGEESALREDLGKIRRVAVRAADLTRKLLLFSRRQQMELVPLNLNQQIREMQRMLGRLLSEDITVELRLAEALWTINADPTAIDQILINLSVNARDAMPRGGVLSLETRNVLVDAELCRQHAQARPGRSACLAVRDTGTGMTEEVRRRIFEPFFTTKEAGKGTGLGLAVVYGLVQAHEGWIAVDSAPGRGSTFSIFLPVLENEEHQADDEAVAGVGRPPTENQPHLGKSLSLR
jgi:PAS domain S-box-containing protein